MMSAELRRGGHGQADGHRATVRGSPLRPRGHHPVRVRWYLRFKLSLRDLVEMMAERGLSGRETANRHDAGLKGLCERGDYDRRYRIDASHPQGTIRTGTSGCPRPTCACSVECRAPSLKSRQYNTGRFPARAICTRAVTSASHPHIASVSGDSKVLTSDARSSRGRELLVADELAPVAMNVSF